MYINNENYELSSDFETDILLAEEMTSNLIKESISHQIRQPLSTRTNFVSSLEDIYYHADYLANGDEDRREELRNHAIKFFQYTLEEMNDVYELGYDIESIESPDVLISHTVALYNFLILRYKKNMCKFLYSYIKKNKKTLVELFKDVAKRKDITTISLKKKYKNKENILLVSNLSTIIKYILSLEIDAYDFILYAEGDEYYEGSVVLELAESQVISDNFTNYYKTLIIDEYESVLDEIQNEVKIKILDKMVEGKSGYRGVTNN